MGKETFHGTEKVQRDYYGRRRLASHFPPIVDYLSPTAHVLDVGCGPGTITLEVAAELTSGTLIGVDSEESSIDKARALASDLGVGNVSFQVGDAYQLPFDTDTFDLTYSRVLIDWLREPVKALQEQKRVTKPGGRVVASLGDWASRIRYPACPAVEKLIAAMDHFSDPAGELFVGIHHGRQAFAFFSDARFEQIEMRGQVYPANVVYAGSEHFDTPHPWRDAGAFAASPFSEQLLANGSIDRATLERADSENAAWRDHPHAFEMSAQVLAVGTVPRAA